jgi:hypothetical protein
MEEDFSDQFLHFLGLLSYPEILSFYCSFLCTECLMHFLIHGHDSAFQLLKMFTCLFIFQNTGLVWGLCDQTLCLNGFHCYIVFIQVLWSNLSPNTGFNGKIFMPFFSPSGMFNNMPSN